MASNKHYSIDLLTLSAEEMNAPSIEELLRVIDLPNTPNPFGNELKRGKYVVDHGKKWLFDNRLSEFNYQTFGYSSEVYQFRFEFSFDTPLKLTELNRDRFIYSIARNISQSGWRNRRQRVGSFFQLGRVEEGSIRGEIFSEIVAAGAFVANYSDLKQGFQEILTDGQFVTEQISTAIRASKLHEPTNDDREHESPDMIMHEERRRTLPPNRIRLHRHD